MVSKTRKLKGGTLSKLLNTMMLPLGFLAVNNTLKHKKRIYKKKRNKKINKYTRKLRN
jgi:hypothetical protein